MRSLHDDRLRELIYPQELRTASSVKGRNIKEMNIY